MKLWKCTEGSIGTAHTHAEKHAPGKLLGKKIPNWVTADPKILHQYVEKIKITDYKVIDDKVKASQ